MQRVNSSRCNITRKDGNFKMLIMIFGLYSVILDMNGRKTKHVLSLPGSMPMYLSSSVPKEHTTVKARGRW